MAKKAHRTVAGEASYILSHKKNFSPSAVKKAVFAHNFGRKGR
jgi:hypothetical protein